MLTPRGRTAKRIHLSMVGRERELQAFQSLLSQAISGHGSVVFIYGEAGIGKTRLVEELGRFCEMTGSQVLIGHCLPGAPMPYLPFLEAMREEGKDGAERCRELCGAPPDKVMFEMLDWIRSISGRSPLVLVLEDLHWADSATVQLLHFLSRNLERDRVLLAATFRPEEIGSEESPHPLAEVLRVMRREGRCKEIDLRLLKEGDVELLINHLVSGRSHHSFVDTVMKETEGNPLFVIETVNLLLQTKELEKLDGFWCAKSDDRAGVPGTVREVVLRRVERLSKPRRRLLECASVVGMSFDVDTLADILGHSRLEVIEALEELETPHSLVRVEQDERFSFSHEAVLRAVYEGISDIRRRELHRMMASRLDGKASDLREISALAYHLERAGESGKALPHDLAAGEGWLKCSGVFEAEPYFKRSLELTTGREELRDLRIRALEGLADCRYERADYKGADELLTELTGMSGGGPLCARIIRKRAECWGPARLGKGSSDTFLQLLDQGELCPLINDFERGELASARALYHLWQGDYYSSNHYSKLSEEFFDRSGNRQRYLSQLLHHVFIYISLGDMERAYANVHKASEVQAGLGGMRGDGEINYALGEILLHQGLYVEAVAALGKGKETLSQLGEQMPKCWCQIFMVLALHLGGENGRAEREADLAVQYAKGAEIPFTVGMALAVRGLVLLSSGDIERAREDLEKAEEAIKGMKARVKMLAPGFVRGVSALVSAREGRTEEAEERFQQSLSLLQGSMTSLLCEAMVRAWYGEELQKVGRKGDSVEQLELALGLLATLGNRAEEAKVSRSLRLLTATEEQVAIAK